MAIPLVCACGARLEIDAKFAGKTIPCPDCDRKLRVPAPEPEKAPVQRTSGLAIASLTVALAGAFTVVGSLAGVVLGFLAERDIRRQPDRLAGVGLARAGMIVGVLGMLMTLAAFGSTEIMGIDALARDLYWADKLQYEFKPDGRVVHDSQNSVVSLIPPSTRWGKMSRSERFNKDRLPLYNPREDAHIVCVPLPDPGDDLAAAKDKALQVFLKSDLVALLGKRVEDKTPEGELKPEKTDDPAEFVITLRLGRFDRTFLVRVHRQGPGDTFLIAGGARKGRFGRLKDDLRKALQSFKVEL